MHVRNNRWCLPTISLNNLLLHFGGQILLKIASGDWILFPCQFLLPDNRKPAWVSTKLHFSDKILFLVRPWSLAFHPSLTGHSFLPFHPSTASLIFPSLSCLPVLPCQFSPYSCQVSPSSFISSYWCRHLSSLCPPLLFNFHGPRSLLSCHRDRSILCP